jgi:hypothetical protein
MVLVEVISKIDGLSGSEVKAPEALRRLGLTALAVGGACWQGGKPGVSQLDPATIRA